MSETRTEEKAPLFDDSAPATFVMADVEIPMPGNLAPRVIPGLEVAYMSESEWLDLSKRVPVAKTLVTEHLVRGWRGVATEFSQAALMERLNRFPSAANAIIARYMDELYGVRRKN